MVRGIIVETRGPDQGATQHIHMLAKKYLGRDYPLFDGYPNVIVTPHTSGAMQDYRTPLVELFAENVRRFDSGRPLLNVVDKALGY